METESRRGSIGSPADLQNGPRRQNSYNVLLTTQLQEPHCPVVSSVLYVARACHGETKVALVVDSVGSAFSCIRPGSNCLRYVRAGFPWTPI